HTLHELDLCKSTGFGLRSSPNLTELVPTQSPRFESTTRSIYPFVAAFPQFVPLLSLSLPMYPSLSLSQCILPSPNVSPLSPRLYPSPTVSLISPQFPFSVRFQSINLVMVFSGIFICLAPFAA